MTKPDDTGQLLDRLRSGDKQARSHLVAHACERLRTLTRRMLRRYPGVRRWEQTDDVLQSALIRLDRALSKVLLESTRHFWNLAILQIKRALLDLADHYKTALEAGRNHHTDNKGKAADDPGGPLQTVPDPQSGEPQSLEEWTRFHELVAGLPQEEREVFDLVWYGGLTKEQAASELDVSVRTVKRRWQSALYLIKKRQDD